MRNKHQLHKDCKAQFSMGSVLFVVLFSGLIGLGLVGCNKKSAKPNVVLILTDDQGWGDFGINENKIVETPRIDKLATQGPSFNRFYVEPLCAPTRASILTGKYHLKTGVRWVTRGFENMRAEEYTLAEMFKDGGYSTGCFGKWHNGYHYPNDPHGQGFDEFVGFKAGHLSNYFNPTLQKAGEDTIFQGYITDVLTDQALSFLREKKNEPFFCYIPYNVPHTPFQVDSVLFQKYYKLLNDKGYSDTKHIEIAAVYAMCENMDTNVGRVLDELDKLQLSENTIVIFLTDNGPNGSRYNGGMNGTKSDVTEGGTRVPFFIRYPDVLKSEKIIEELGAHIDVLPTLASLCNLELPDSLDLDGRDLTPLLMGTANDWPNRYIFSHNSKEELTPFRGSVRNKEYSLTWYNDNKIALYNLKKDYNQTTDIATEEPEMRDSLLGVYNLWYNQMADNYQPETRISIGYDAAPKVTLNAHESFMAGNPSFFGIKGFSHDWIINWKSVNDSIWWEVDVVNEGNYEVSVKYAVPQDDLGNVIQVRSVNDSIQAQITEAFDPAPYPHRDLLPRWGVYEKPFREMTFGNIYLNKGNQSLYIQAINEVKGKQVAELKAVILKKVN